MPWHLTWDEQCALWDCGVISREELMCRAEVYFTGKKLSTVLSVILSIE